LRPKSPYLYPPGTGWPSYTPRLTSFSSSLTTCRDCSGIILTRPHSTGLIEVILNRRPVAQFVLVSGTLLELITRFFLSLSFMRQLLSSYYMQRRLWREGGYAVCNRIVHCFESRMTHTHILLSHLRLPQFVSPRNSLTQLYSPRPDSIFVAPYDKQILRWKHSNPPPLGYTSPKVKVKVI
jgi:hypothetical protein